MHKVDDKDDGGSAFPSAGSKLAQKTAGMSLRDYFIAHAPAEPQSWFKPQMDEPRPTPLWTDDSDETRTFETVSEAEVACDYYHDANERAIIQWDADYDKQRFIQWPIAWADAMLAERAK
jgi:hypothetical protein